MLEPDARETEILDEADVSWIGLISTDFRPLQCMLAFQKWLEAVTYVNYSKI